MTGLEQGQKQERVNYEDPVGNWSENKIIENVIIQEVKVGTEKNQRGYKKWSQKQAPKSPKIKRILMAFWWVEQFAQYQVIQNALLGTGLDEKVQELQLHCS